MRKPQLPTKKNKETRIAKIERMQEFLEAHKVGVLATVDPNQNPSATPIYYVVGPKLTIMFMTKKRTKKSDNLEHRNHAMLVVFDEKLQITAQVTGIVTETKSEEDRNIAFRNMISATFNTSGKGVPPIAKLDAGEFIAYKLQPAEIRLANYGKAQAPQVDIIESYDM